MASEMCQEAFEGARLTERKDGSKEPLILSNVAFLGPVSIDDSGKVRRRYTKDALRQVSHLIEGKSVFVDHQRKTDVLVDEARSVRDIVGFVQNARLAPDGKVRGDVRLLEGSADVDRILWFAEHTPKEVGFSPTLFGSRRLAADNVPEAYTVTAVESGDLVHGPATTAGIFESRHYNEKGGEESMEIENLTLDDLAKQRPDLVESIRGQASDEQELTELRAENARLQEQIRESKKAEFDGAVDAVLENVPESLHDGLRKIATLEGCTIEAFREHVKSIGVLRQVSAQSAKKEIPTEDAGSSTTEGASEEEIRSAFGG